MHQTSERADFFKLFLGCIKDFKDYEQSFIEDNQKYLIFLLETLRLIFVTQSKIYRFISTQNFESKFSRSAYISELEEHESTISTNLENYNKRLKTIAENMANNPEELKFLKSFSDFAEAKYVAQVEADLRSLSAGLRLLENAIATIEGIIEIERAKSDRTLNVTIAAAGVGIATSGVYASTYASQIDSKQNPIPADTVFWSSLVLGILVAGAIALIAIGKKWR